MPKKKTALTIEERLQQALVPAEKQPYEVPENWVWVRLGDVCGFERGITFPSSAKHNERLTIKSQEVGKKKFPYR